MLISSVLFTKDHISPFHAGVNTGMFHTYQEEWKWVERYITKYKKAPGKAAFDAQFPKVKLVKTQDVEHWIEEVRRSHAKWELATIINETVDALSDGHNPIDLMHKAYQDLIVLQGDISGTSAEIDVIGDWSFVYDDVKRRVENVKRAGAAGVQSGYQTLDSLTGGAQPGDFWVVAARLGEGKTWTLLRMAASAWASGKNVQYVSLEQTRTQIGIRVHTLLSADHHSETFRHFDLQQGRNLNLREYRRWLESLDAKGGLPRFRITDATNGRFDPLRIAGVIERNKPDVVYVDYITLVEAKGEDWRATANISHEMKWIAQKFQVPIIVAAQINRMGIGMEPPSVEHLSQSDAIGMDADCVVTLKQMSKHVTKMRLAKFRNGGGGDMWWCKFDPNNGKYEEVSGNDAQNLIELDKAGKRP